MASDNNNNNNSNHSNNRNKKKNNNDKSKKASWSTTRLWVEDVEEEVKFYVEKLNFQVVGKSDEGTYIASVQEGGPSKALEEGLVTLKISKAEGKEKGWKPNNGNVEPHRGFGHVAVTTEDVFVAEKQLLEAGVPFQKKTTDGRMRTIAFFLSPAGYWIELIGRSNKEEHQDPAKIPADAPASTYNLSQTMIRVKDPKRSLAFYKEVLDMKELAVRHFEAAKFSLFFLASLTPQQIADIPSEASAAWKYMHNLRIPVLELTHNHGTEADGKFSYHTHEEPIGFDRLGFLVPDLSATLSALQSHGFASSVSLSNGQSSLLISDPDGYQVELIQK